MPVAFGVSSSPLNLGMALPAASIAYAPSRYVISGTTRDSFGNILAGCSVEVFETVSGLLRGSTTSDANGNYTLYVTGGQGLTFFCNAYLPGSPDVAGTTINTLVGS